MTAGQPTRESGPVRESARITSLDLIRGVAVHWSGSDRKGTVSLDHMTSFVSGA